MGLPPTAEPRATVTIPLRAAVADGLPSVCVLTGEPTAGRWTRKFARSTAYIPVREQLVALQGRRLRLAWWLLLGLGASWGCAIVMALIGEAVPASSPVGPIAAVLFLAGLGCVFSSIVLLLRGVSTIPIRWRGFVGDDRAAYLRILDAHPAFVAALNCNPAPAALVPAQSAPNDPGLTLQGPEPLRTASPPPRPGRLDRRLRLRSYGFGFGLALVIFVTLVPLHVTATDLPDFIFLVVLLAALGVLAAASRWRIHIGRVFILTPANAVAILGCAALAGAAGLISTLGAQPDTAGVELAAGLGAAATVIVVAVVGQIIWHLVRPR